MILNQVNDMISNQYKKAVNKIIPPSGIEVQYESIMIEIKRGRWNPNGQSNRIK